MTENDISGGVLDAAYSTVLGLVVNFGLATIKRVSVGDICRECRQQSRHRHFRRMERTLRMVGGRAIRLDRRPLRGLHHILDILQGVACPRAVWSLGRIRRLRARQLRLWHRRRRSWLFNLFSSVGTA